MERLLNFDNIDQLDVNPSQRQCQIRDSLTVVFHRVQLDYSHATLPAQVCFKGARGTQKK